MTPEGTYYGSRSILSPDRDEFCDDETGGRGPGHPRPRPEQVLDVLVQKRRNAPAAIKLLRRLLKNQGIFPEAITIDKSASYRSAWRKLGILDRNRTGGMRQNNRAENRHLPLRRRERKP